jgi:hypothetical protein
MTGFMMDTRVKPAYDGSVLTDAIALFGPGAAHAH